MADVAVQNRQADQQEPETQVCKGSAIQSAAQSARLFRLPCICRRVDHASEKGVLPKRSSLLNQLAEADNSATSVLAMPAQGFNQHPVQQQVQQCSNKAESSSPATAPDLKAAAPSTIAACPICSLRLPIHELTLHIEQELTAAAEQDDSNGHVASAQLNQDEYASHAAVPCEMHYMASKRSRKHQNSKPAAANQHNKVGHSFPVLTGLSVQIMCSVHIDACVIGGVNHAVGCAAVYQLQVLVLGGDHTKAPLVPCQPRKTRAFMPAFDHYTGGAGTWVCVFAAECGTNFCNGGISLKLLQKKY